MKEFNITGTCIPNKNYMVDTSGKLQKILKMIERGNYFTINRPRQFGKTTTLNLLQKALSESEEYLPIFLSFEGLDSSVYETQKGFITRLLKLFGDNDYIKEAGHSEMFYEKMDQFTGFTMFSDFLTKTLPKIEKKIVLMIDEVDRTANYDLFVELLAMLRSKFLKAQADMDITFHSVILAGVHDIKTLKQKIRPDSDSMINSPWNIAADFRVDMSFNTQEIQTMLNEYMSITGVSMDVDIISKRLHFWTSGYPFLVSKLCLTVDEILLPNRCNETDCQKWLVADIDKAVEMLLAESNTLFDAMLKYLENSDELFSFIKRVVLGETDFSFEILDPIIHISYLYGIIDRSERNKVQIHNKIFEEKITSYFLAKIQRLDNGRDISDSTTPYLKNNGRLDFDKVMLKFQEAIKEKYRESKLMQEEKYLEEDFRLLFLVFLKPIINGYGFSFKEVQTGGERRLDVVVVFKDEKFVVELKIWRGDEYHQEGIKQLKHYMELESINKGYMLIMNKNKNKEFRHSVDDGILMVWV